MRRLVLVVAALASGAVLATTVNLAPATGDSAKTGSVRQWDFKIKTLRATNGLDEVRATAVLDRLPRKGYAAFDFDNGYQEADSPYYHRWRLSIGKHGKRPVAGLMLSSDVTGENAVPCPHLVVRWNRQRKQITAVVPQSCFGEDAGMTRVGFVGPSEANGPSLVQTRPLQRGRRGARYGDVNGDGKPDAVRVRKASATQYKVIVDLGRKTLEARGRNAGAVSSLFSKLDVDKDGRAEVVVDAGEIGGARHLHFFSLVRGELVPLRLGGEVFAPLVSTLPNGESEHGLKCSASGITTWQTTNGGDKPDMYHLETESWSLDEGRVESSGEAEADVPKSVAVQGNWSPGSCLTR